MTLSGWTQDVAFTLPERDLIPECIGWSATTKCFFISSIFHKKIVRYFPATGQCNDFIKSGQDDFDAGIGLIVDNRRQRLWALCGRKSGETYIRGIYIWDIRTGALLHHYRQADTLQQLFNDLALDKKGNAYITDTYAGKIYQFSMNHRHPENFGSGIPFPNGITHNKKHTLYIASHTEGIVSMDIRTKEKKYLEVESLPHTSKGLDGLKYFRGSLIGVFNASQQRTEQRVVRFTLDERRSRIMQVDIIDAGHPRFVVPTTGVVVKNQYYLIANSCLDFLDQETFSIPDISVLTDPVILKYELSKKVK